MVGLGHGFDGRQRGAVVRLFGDLQRRREPDRGGHGRGVGLRRGRRHHRLRDHRRRGPGPLLDRGDVGGADVRRGAELRGAVGHRHEQHLRGRGGGHQRRGRAREDGDADDHGDGDRRGRRGAGQAGRAGRVGGVGDEPERELVGAVERRPADHRLRLPPPDVAGRELDGGHGHGDHGAVGEVRATNDDRDWSDWTEPTRRRRSRPSYDVQVTGGPRTTRAPATGRTRAGVGRRSRTRRSRRCRR